MLPSSFRYAITPTVTAVSPARGPATTGTTLTVTGTGFVAGQTTVQFAIGASPWYSASTVVVDSPTSLRATAPGSMYASAFAILVTTPGGTAMLPNVYTAVNPPQLYQVLPTTGPAGAQTLVTLSGWEFASGDTRVTVGGIDATNVTVTSATTLQAQTPASAAGARDVVVTTAGGSATLTGRVHVRRAVVAHCRDVRRREGHGDEHASRHRLRDDVWSELRARCQRHADGHASHWLHVRRLDRQWLLRDGHLHRDDGECGVCDGGVHAEHVSVRTVANGRHR